MFSLGGPSDIDVEKEKQRLLPNMFPNFAQFFGSFPPTPGMPNFRGNTPVTSTPTSIAAAAAASGVFPMFPPNFAPQYFAIMQQQNQLMQQFSKNAAMNESSSTSAGSESRSSSTDSASKIQLSANPTQHDDFTSTKIGGHCYCIVKIIGSEGLFALFSQPTGTSTSV
uniref:GATA-type domain-containing protein n=1 Tax=Panagrellus redivivus TaxID=6233 RepID=A0A7E4UTP2_PANRE